MKESGVWCTEILSTIPALYSNAAFSHLRTNTTLAPFLEIKDGFPHPGGLRNSNPATGHFCKQQAARERLGRRDATIGSTFQTTINCAHMALWLVAFYRLREEKSCHRISWPDIQTYKTLSVGRND